MYTIEAAKKAIKDGMEVYLQKDEKGQYCMEEVNRLPFYLEGPPGIGKTEIVKQIAEELDIGYVSFSLTHHTRNSLLGLPVIKNLEHGKYTEYTMSEIIAKVLEQKEKGRNEGILLLDEFSCIFDSILPAMLAFLQTKNIGMHTLPEGWIIVLCGNPPQYNQSAKKLDPAILDRIRKISVEFDSGVFLAYAKEKKMHPVMCAYLGINPSNVYMCESNNRNQQLVTCRGWENLSHALYGMEQLEKTPDEELVGQFIKSGEIAHNFYTFYGMYKMGITEKDIKAILNGKNINRYVEKYKERDVSVWWNALDVIEDYLLETHKEAGDILKKLQIANRLLPDLSCCEEISTRIWERLHNQNSYKQSDSVSMWCNNSPSYEPLCEPEKEMLEEWQQRVEECSDFNMSTKEEDEEYVRQINQWREENNKLLMEEYQVLSKEISNVFRFVRDNDEMLTEKVYQMINHRDVFLMAVTKTKNKDYIRVCKRNYALEI